MFWGRNKKRENKKAPDQYHKIAFHGEIRRYLYFLTEKKQQQKNNLPGAMIISTNETFLYSSEAISS